MPLQLPYTGWCCPNGLLWFALGCRIEGGSAKRFSMSSAHEPLDAASCHAVRFCQAGRATVCTASSRRVVVSPAVVVVLVDCLVPGGRKISQRCSSTGAA